MTDDILKLKEIIKNIIKILEKAYQNNLQYALSDFKNIYEVLDNEIDMDSFLEIKRNIENHFLPYRSLAEFYVWVDDFEERKRINNNYSNYVKAMFEILKKYDNFYVEFKDSDIMIEIHKKYIESTSKDFPTICPACNEKQAHIYMHRWNDSGDKGGLWVWCSSCGGYAHYTIKIPTNWKNIEEIDFSKLSHEPYYLEKHKETIDNHTKKEL